MHIKSPVQDALAWSKIDELGAFLFCSGKRTKHILGLFQLMREEPDQGTIHEQLQQNVAVEDRLRILDFLYVFLRQHIMMCNHNIEKCVPIPGMQSYADR